MRVLGSLVLLTLSTVFGTALAAEKQYAKFSSIWKSKGGPISLTSSLYEDLVSTPRNYSALVLLTAMDSKYGCVMCREFQPEYDLLGKSWQSQHKTGNGLFISTLDFSKGKEVFMKLGLNTAPILYLFPPTTGEDANLAHAENPLQFDFPQHHVSAEAVALWVTRNTPTEVKVVRPFDYAKLAFTVGSLLVGLSGLKFAYSALKPLLYSRNLWAAVSLILILLFTSGHMFNHIRKVPYVAGNGRGGVAYIAGGFSNQFGMETQIVAVIYAVLAFSAISLGMKMPTIANPQKQKIAIWVWNALLLVTFSILLSIFRQKNGGYPFRLPPLV